MVFTNLQNRLRKIGEKSVKQYSQMKRNTVKQFYKAFLWFTDKILYTENFDKVTIVYNEIGYKDFFNNPNNFC